MFLAVMALTYALSVFYVSAFYFILWAVVSAGYSALFSSSYSERINDDDDDDEMAMQPREPAQCQLYRHTFVAYRSELAECLVLSYSRPRSNSCWPRCGQSAYAVDATLSACRRQGARLLLMSLSEAVE